jgi:succinyl-diaminopimelate desuccinylase
MADQTAAAAAIAQDEKLSESFLMEVLGSLVRTQSVNPGIYEAEMAAKVSSWLEPTGAEVELVEMAPGRPSVGAVLRGSGDGPRLVLNGHMDTVPIDDESLWDTLPFDPVIKGDRHMYGRGACDMKAGLATQIAAAHHLAALDEPLKGDLVLHFAAGEECAEPGTLSLIEAGYVGDYGITTEPTELKVATAQRGLAFYTVRVKGRSIHASRAHLGKNPVDWVPIVLQTIKEYEADVTTRQHSLCPGGSCTPTVVSGGVKENAVSDYVDVTVDRRLIPGETVDGELEDMRGRLQAVQAADPEFDFEVRLWDKYFEPAEIAEDSPFARQMAGIVERVTGTECEIYGTPYSSDVRNLVNDAGMEAITFGAGNVAECHCANERISVDQVRAAAIATATIARELLL